MTSQTAYLLVSHGSRDSHPQIALESLADLVKQQLNHLSNNNGATLGTQPLYETQLQPRFIKTATIIKKTAPIVVETATLELGTYSLHERIQQVAEKVQPLGIDKLKIVPLFLLKGVHVTEDIPEQIELARQNLSHSIKLELSPYLGNSPQIIPLLAGQFSQLTAGKRILLSHGSRRSQANQQIEQIASQLGAKPAYWSVSPSLAQQIATMANSETKTIAIMPYFLFRGGIIEAIAQEIQHLQSTYRDLTLHLGNPLEATPELASLIVEAQL
ncbi:cobalamin (vitamin B12) biosynthesis CbiX protein [Gloeothece citriformis PCC 7424]|uniref:Cobalamin (Vitamin B12) biosynthesis CbiX protein n=1 Tax=Gloeothece citriformis (strain PCC 7424) TaxID=65393 RepID=B7KBF8_GLOC7|nr:sirohydrochlorin chelatase [Gloeothece citriformis]ACK71514.1 cobalamin (vitamin B12) biosynthesis CbiX protein [Gloeothece citriformis PCC 7424]